jgi:dihydroorotase
MTDRLTIRRPDDWHVHLRDGAMLEACRCLITAAPVQARAIIMPNLVAAGDDSVDARVRRIASASWRRGAGRHRLHPADRRCYLTDASDPDEMARGFMRRACLGRGEALSRAGATTNAAHHGVTDVAKHHAPVLERMAEDRHAGARPRRGRPTPTSTSSTARRCSSRPRCSRRWSGEACRGLKVVVEHVTTSEAVAFVKCGLMPANVGGDGDAAPSASSTAPRCSSRVASARTLYCLPVAKREQPSSRGARKPR